jgi:hypothetical protein
MTEWRLANGRESVKVPRRMKLLFQWLGHLLVTFARLASRGGLRSVVAESLAVKHQLLIMMRRSQRRAPNLTSWDRLMLGFYTLLVSPKRSRKMAVITKASTPMRLHQALVKRKYHLLSGCAKFHRAGCGSATTVLRMRSVSGKLRGTTTVRGLRTYGFSEERSKIRRRSA